MPGDTDIAATAAVLADASRARILLALGDGRALAASVLAAEAGVAASTASAHLAKLVDAGLLTVERHGRHRYYRLAGPEVADLLEALARVAPASPIRSLRQGTRAEAVRFARTCYDHLAGRVGTEVMAALLSRGVLAGGDGTFDPARDRLSSRGRGVEYELTEEGRPVLARLGVDVESLERSSRPLLRYCIDWSEQRHHLAGGLGAALTARLFDLGWLGRIDRSRAVLVTGPGRVGLASAFGVDVEGIRAGTDAGAVADTM